jgi:hypothetical protein
LEFWLSAVVGDDAGYFVVGVEFHELGGFCAFVVDVMEDDAGHAEESIQQLELQLRKGCQAAGEIAAEGVFAFDGGVREIEELGNDRRGEGDVGGVVGEDGVEVVGVPGVDPVASELLGGSLGEHGLVSYQGVSGLCAFEERNRGKSLPQRERSRRRVRGDGRAYAMSEEAERVGRTNAVGQIERVGAGGLVVRFAAADL